MGFTDPLTPSLDVDRHGGENAPTSSIPKPQLGPSLDLNIGVIDSLPVPGTVVISARHYGRSLWGETAKIVAKLPGGDTESYFLKTISRGETGRLMIQGEFESLKAIHNVSPELVPLPYTWGKFDKPASLSGDTYFLLMQFREVGEQPPDPEIFTARLADFHKKSKSPTGKFGFHVTSYHATLPQITDCWEDSWEVLYKKQLEHMIRLDEEKHGAWPDFQKVCKLTLEVIIPRLLRPLQSEGRTIKPCLLHGDLWDENTATDPGTGQPFIFDAGSFYGHNEYEIGNWRSARHRLSGRAYVKNYKQNFTVSEPKDEWDDRNLLYSLRYDLSTAILIPGCNMRQVVKNNMTLLCNKFCPTKLGAEEGL
ncbi:Fructosamine kinase-domain-containing protein [Nemania sp. FL0031]|nr:Fructosamine kinase-domain-containing protein [Nemania sp. FL0031]